MTTERYLVTGGAGFIGSHLVETLVGQGAMVRVLDNFSTGKHKNLAPFVSQIEVLDGDLRDMDAVRQAVEGVTYVLHQAALPSVPRSIDAPLTSNECNVTGTLNLLVASRDAGVKRVVYASSSSVYGDNPKLPKEESMLPRPKSPYAVAKLAAEHYCQAFTSVYGLETVSVRYFNVFGPRQDPTSAYAAVIPKFITLMLRGEAPQIHGDGRQSRDFTYISNNVHANLLATTAPDGVGKAFNIACGARYTLLDLVDRINDILGTKITPVHVQSRAGDVPHSEADISAARRDLGYEPLVDFHEGLERTVTWYRAQLG